MYKIIGADGKEYGPITADQLRQWIAEGRVNAQTRILPEGATEWRSLSELPEFAAAVPLTPPPMSGLPASGTARLDEVNGPAIGLMITAILGLLAQLTSLLFRVVGTSMLPAEQEAPGWATALYGATGVVTAIIGILMSILIFIGALKMKQLSQLWPGDDRQYCGDDTLHFSLLFAGTADWHLGAGGLVQAGSKECFPLSLPGGGAARAPNRSQASRCFPAQLDAGRNEHESRVYGFRSPPDSAAIRSKAPAAGLLPVVLVSLALAGLVLFCFEPSHHSFYPVCFFHRSTGLLCPGCGSLRALHQLLHGHFLTALHFNALLVSSLPLFGWLAVRFALRTARKQPAPFAIRPAWLWSALAAAIVFGILRNLPFAQFAWLAPQ